MKLTLTADVHLKTRQETPHRWQALEDILNQLVAQDIQHLIIAGDLFDHQAHNYSQLDQLCQQKKFAQLQLHVIPGNHDPALKQANFTAPNIKLYEEPTTVTFPQSDKQFFFIPYQEDKGMGRILAEHKDNLTSPWILIGHGNWADTIRTPNHVEPGVYMPLSRSTLKTYQPALTILGHIHKPLDETQHNVYYPGSPCGLDITETGPRSYLTLNLENLEVGRQEIKTEMIYFDEQLVVYPMEHETDDWRQQLDQLKSTWNSVPDQTQKVMIRIKVRGYTSNKKKLKQFFETALEDFAGWKGQKLDLSQLNSADNQELLQVSQRVSAKINELELPTPKPGQPSKEQILEAAIRTIYQVS